MGYSTLEEARTEIKRLEEELTMNKIKQLMNLFAIGAVVLGTTFCTVRDENRKYIHIPRFEQVQQGHVVPSKLEIVLEDLDGNGAKEVLMEYDGKKYLLTLDEQGRPRVQAYEVKPAEVVPKE